MRQKLFGSDCKGLPGRNGSDLSIRKTSLKAISALTPVDKGNGEFCGTALEISSKVTLRVELIKGKEIKWPRIESSTKLLVVGSARPMEDTARSPSADWRFPVK